MHLSRVYIENYKSIKSIDLKFEQGKNVVVGRNNAGKSNILKAIDLILGESTPIYERLENITENDFFNGDINNTILIYCELRREPNEALNYTEIYKCYGYKIHSQVKTWENNKPKLKEAIRHKISEDKLSEDLIGLFKITEESVGYDWEYINPKLLNQKTYANQLDDKYIFAYVFRASLDEHGKIVKDMRFIYRESEKDDWILALKATIRNELIKSAIIPSFRDPQSQLRISNWSWYGKLLKAYVNPKNPKLLKAFKEVKDASEDVFKALEDKINHSKVKIAFPQTKISFQFNPETKQDVHKSALIYVDDGFKSQLQDKGSGIQSAVIIGLFDFYIKEIAKAGGNSLLVIEEPELYLHPHGRRVISDRLDDFLDGDKNQVVISTHSSEFISTISENINLIVVKKDDVKGTVAKNASFKTAKEKQILLKSQNTEMFFADFVILVEGADKYILEILSTEYGKSKKIIRKVGKETSELILGRNWLDDYNISVINCGGKTEFCKYATKLYEAGIPWAILTDFDFFIEALSDFCTKTNVAKETRDKINEVKSKFKISLCKKFDDIPTANKKDVEKIMDEFKKKENIFILKKELDDYYNDKAKEIIKGIDGKEQRVIQIVSSCCENNKAINSCVECTEFCDFLDMVVDKFKIAS